MQNPKISIIVPVYNVEAYLPKCLDSLINQTLKDIEIICINDGSTDKSLEILQKYAKEDKRIKIIDQENQGPGVTRNNGIEVVTGDYIMFLDCDDWLDTNACELAYNQINKYKNDIVFFNFKRFYESSKKTFIDNDKLSGFKKIMNNPQINLATCQNQYMKTAYTWSQIYSKKFVVENDIKYSETFLCEDLVFLVKAIINANTVSVLNKPIYNYRVRKSSISFILKELSMDLITNSKIALNLIQESEKEMDYIYPFLMYLINSSSYWVDATNSLFSSQAKEFYTALRSIFLNINNKYNVEKIKKQINYKHYKRICKYNYYQFTLFKCLKYIFEIKNINTHKVINILGIRIKIKKG